MNPPVVSPQEYGRRGNAVMRSRHTVAELRAWVRKGGRPRDLTWEELQAKKAPTRSKGRVTKSKGGRPITDFDCIT